MTVKESFDVAGLPTTWGSPAHRKNIAARNALAVDRWLAAGVVLFGKTNVPIWLADAQSFNAVYGTTNNPWDTARTPGGSSGGAAASLAAGMTGIEMGSDIASSLKNPAHFCGVFSHKPTYGICPPSGHSLEGGYASADISAIGPLARSTADLSLGLSIMAGPDEIDRRGYKLALPPPAKKKLADYKVAMITHHRTAPVDRELRGLLGGLGDFLEGEGAGVDRKARPQINMEDAHRTFDVLLRAATSARQDDAQSARYQKALKRLPKGDDSKAGRMLRGNTMAHRDWLRLDETRHSMRWKWHEFFADYDLLLCPPMCTPAFPHDHAPPYERETTINGKQYPFMTQTFWAGLSGVAYLPASTAPIGLTKGGLPLGVQIVGPHYGDRACLHFAGLLEKHYRKFQPPPGYD
jgi:amidase